MLNRNSLFLHFLNCAPAHGPVLADSAMYPPAPLNWRCRTGRKGQMTGQDTTLSGARHAREELRERCLALVRRWQPLAQGGWDQAAASRLGDEVEQIADTSERLGLDDVNGSALEVSAYLCSFVDDRLVPSAKDLGRLADMVNRLGFVLTDLSATATAAVHALPTARAAEPAPVEMAVATPEPSAPLPEMKPCEVPVSAEAALQMPTLIASAELSDVAEPALSPP